MVIIVEVPSEHFFLLLTFVIWLHLYRRIDRYFMFPTLWKVDEIIRCWLKRWVVHHWLRELNQNKQHLNFVSQSWIPNVHVPQKLGKFGLLLRKKYVYAFIPEVSLCFLILSLLLTKLALTSDLWCSEGVTKTDSGMNGCRKKRKSYFASLSCE